MLPIATAFPQKRLTSSKNGRSMLSVQHHSFMETAPATAARGSLASVQNDSQENAM